MTIIKMEDLDLAGKRVLIRQDLNVPIVNGQVSSSTLIDASLPSLKLALEAGAKVMVMSHLGRPTEGKFEAKYSLQPVADYMSEALGRPVPLITNYLVKAPSLNRGEIALLENVRFNVGENENNEMLSRQYATLCDIYVMDALGTAHSAQASTHGVGKFAPAAVAGPLLPRELKALAKELPVIAMLKACGEKYYEKLDMQLAMGM